eukprot:2552803-Amphidinium_carterae.1
MRLRRLFAFVEYQSNRRMGAGKSGSEARSVSASYGVLAVYACMEAVSVGAPFHPLLCQRKGSVSFTPLDFPAATALHLHGWCLDDWVVLLGASVCWVMGLYKVGGLKRHQHADLSHFDRTVGHLANSRPGSRCTIPKSCLRAHSIACAIYSEYQALFVHASVQSCGVDPFSPVVLCLLV